MIILAICWTAILIIIGIIVFSLLVIALIEIVAEWIYKPELWKRIVCVIVRTILITAITYGLYYWIAINIEK